MSRFHRYKIHRLPHGQQPSARAQQDMPPPVAFGHSACGNQSACGSQSARNELPGRLVITGV